MALPRLKMHSLLVPLLMQKISLQLQVQEESLLLEQKTFRLMELISTVSLLGPKLLSVHALIASIPYQQIQEQEQ